LGGDGPHIFHGADRLLEELFARAQAGEVDLDIRPGWVSMAGHIIAKVGKKFLSVFHGP
jgi:hypothetical protein